MATGFVERVKSLLSFSAYSRPVDVNALSLTSPDLVRIRKLYGGQLAPPSRAKCLWYAADLDDAERLADQGFIGPAARLMKAAKRNGIYVGALSTRTAGLVRLSKKFRGDPTFVRELQLGSSSVGTPPHSLFDEVCSPAELTKLDADGVELGVGVAELVPVEGRDVPVLVRLDPEYLQYRWSENQWYYQTVVGLIPITPGDGRWVLHTPGGRNAPWQSGIWRAVGRAYIERDHAQNHKANYEGKLANPARVAEAPQAASEEQQEGWFQQVAAWGINTVFQTKPGYKATLLESNGRGWECFVSTIHDCDQEMVITVSGQSVTTDGGSGFINGDLFKSIRSDIIQADAGDLAFTCNTQIIPAILMARWGEEALDTGAVVEWDVAPPKDNAAQAQVMVSAANAIKLLGEALAPYKRELDISLVCQQYGIPVVGDADGDGAPDELLDDEDAIDVEFEVVEPEAQAPAQLTADATTQPAESEAVPGADSAQDLALNGAQVTSLVEIIKAVAAGEIPRDSALRILMLAYLIDEPTADKLLGSVGTPAFKPAAEETAAPAQATEAA